MTKYRGKNTIKPVKIGCRKETALDMRNRQAKKVAWTGMMLALCLVLSYLESMLSPLLGLAPGIKLGLANIVVMYAILCLDTKQAFVLVLLKSFFGLITRGAVAGMVSLGGGLVSLLVMVLLLKASKPTHFILSASGAIAHNIGQLMVASVVLGSGLAMGYAPVLMVAGLIVGGVNSLLLDAVLPSLQKISGK